MYNLFLQEIEDKSGGCGQMFAIIVVSKQFEDVPLLKRQRQVNEILKDVLSEVHALEMKTWTEQQWEKQKSK